MNELLNKLFGIGVNSGGEQSLGFGSPDAELGFVHPLPAWAVVLIVLAMGMLVLWSYRKLPGPKPWRSAMAGLRLGVLTALIVLAMGPMIEQTTITTERDWSLVLLDRSASMGTRDAIDPVSGSLVSRAQQLTTMLESGRESWEMLAQEKRVVWLGFADRAAVLTTGAMPDAGVLIAPDGPTTNLGGAIRAALDMAAGRPISSIVISSDGRGLDAVDPELINELAGAQIPVYVAPLGSDGPVRDLSIARVEHPGAVFGDDIVPIRVRLGGAGFDAEALRRAGARVELVDHATGRVLESAPIEAANLGGEGDNSDRQPEWVALSHTPEGTGERALDVRIALDEHAAGLDLNPSNDGASVRFSIVERPMRVLYIDGYPRWDERYLKNLLLREKSIVSSSLMLSASRRYIQEGDELIAAVPTTAEGWEPFDVVILGDVRAEMFSRQQLESLLEHVRTRGAGVLWAAGPSATPGTWFGTPLGALLPLRGDAGGSQTSAPAWDTAVTMRSTDEALRLGVLGLGDDRASWLERLSDPVTGWSKLQWALALDQSAFKPGVGVLATASSVERDETAPIVTMMRYGAGRSIFVGTDEVWRWRYGRGEVLPERFWLPLIRALGRGTVERRAAPAAITLTPASPAPGEPAQITLRLFDQAAIDTLPEQIRIKVESSNPSDEPVNITLRGSGDTRTGTWVADDPGSYTLTPSGLDIALAGISAQARVLGRSDERRLLDTDHPRLRALAQQTGGEVIEPARFGEIPGLMPNRTRSIASPPTRVSLWDRPIVLAALVVMLTSEWIARRVLRLA